MNKLLILVFLGLLLAMLRLSAPATHHNQAARRAAPVRYPTGLPATALPASSRVPDSSRRASRHLLVATQH